MDTSTVTRISEAQKLQNNPTRPLKVDYALNYLDSIRMAFVDGESSDNRFRDIMQDFKNNIIDTAGVIFRVAHLFNGNSSLISGFNMFLPEGYRIDVYTHILGHRVVTITTPTVSETINFNSATGTPMHPANDDPGPPFQSTDRSTESAYQHQSSTPSDNSPSSDEEIRVDEPTSVRMHQPLGPPDLFDAADHPSDLTHLTPSDPLDAVMQAGPATTGVTGQSSASMFENARVQIFDGTFHNVAHVHAPTSDTPHFPMAVLGSQAVAFAAGSHFGYQIAPSPTPSIPPPFIMDMVPYYSPLYEDLTVAARPISIVWVLYQIWRLIRRQH